MNKEGPIADASGNFQWFVKQCTSSSFVTLDDEKYLQTYLVHWLEEGNGIEYTGRNYETYLQVVADLADTALRGELDLNYMGIAGYGSTVRERRLEGIHEPGREYSSFLDRATYEVAAYRHENHGRRSLAEELPLPPHAPDRSRAEPGTRS